MTIRKQPDRNRGRDVNQAGLAFTIPSLLLSGPLTGWLLGYMINRTFDIRDPWDKRNLLIWIALGFAAAVREIAKVIRKLSRED